MDSVSSVDLSDGTGEPLTDAEPLKRSVSERTVFISAGKSPSTFNFTENRVQICRRKGLHGSSTVDVPLIRTLQAILSWQ